MRIHVISCKTIEREVTKAMKETRVTYPVSWIESGLHNFPKKLNKELQKLLNEIEADRVLLVMGTCGNSLEGLQAGDYELIFPRVDDCISLMLGSVENRRMIERTYFLTKGWLEGERNIYEEYKYTMEKYGEKLGSIIMKMLLGEYRKLGILDTDTYDYQKLLDETVPIAEELQLEQVPIKATYKLMNQLLTGPWDEDFCVIKPHEYILAKDLIM